jgi:uncharacterized lipoprotein YddW (UPF0748 family)
VKSLTSDGTTEDFCMKPRHRFFLAFVLLFTLSLTLAQAPPKREFRGAWIATVSNLDWPLSPGADPDAQRAQLTSTLDALRIIGINAVVFQVRPACDAFYFSQIEPWSYWLTGQQGAAPTKPFDPLTFAVIEAHKRGIELHAWFNPYRAEVKVGQFALAANHVVNQHPEWILTFGSLRTLDPGIPEVRNYVVRVIMDVVRRYEIDGIHWDDYFYPYSGIANEDSASWRQFNRGFANKADWRRDNVNLLVQTVHDSLLAVKPDVKFGISPFGIWKNGIPSGIVGMSSFDDIYCDPVTWLDHQWIDYVTPQLYWPFGGSQDYGKLMPWWSSVKKGGHFYPGQAAYRITDGNWGATEVPNQIRLNRTNSLAQGSVFFRANYGVVNNPKGFADSLKSNLYKYPALRPIMQWKETTPPNSPQSLTIAKFSSSALLSWTAPSAASDGGLADQYVIYRSTSLPINVDDARNIVTIQGSTSYAESTLPSPGVTYYYGITALDRLQNESGLSNIMGLTSSGIVGIDEQAPVVSDFRLFQNYPNPFNPSTIIAFHMPSEQQVSLRVYDLLGREVRVLADGVLSAGDHRYQFDGSRLSSGVYIYRVVAGSHVESKKMQLVK